MHTALATPKLEVDIRGSGEASRLLAEGKPSFNIKKFLTCGICGAPLVNSLQQRLLIICRRIYFFRKGYASGRTELLTYIGLLKQMIETFGTCSSESWDGPIYPLTLGKREVTLEDGGVG
jgi:hypothetical protein